MVILRSVVAILSFLIEFTVTANVAQTSHVSQTPLLTRTDTEVQPAHGQSQKAKGYR